MDVSGDPSAAFVGSTPIMSANNARLVQRKNACFTRRMPWVQLLHRVPVMGSEVERPLPRS